MTSPLFDRRTLLRAELAGISPFTLRDHERYGRPIMAPTARLLELHDTGRIIPADWTGFAVDALGDYLDTPGGRLAPGEIENLVFLRQRAEDAIAELREARARLAALEDELRQFHGAANDGAQRFSVGVRRVDRYAHVRDRLRATRAQYRGAETAARREIRRAR